MLVLGIETSCDESGVALYDDALGQALPRDGLLAHALHSQVRMHEEYGGVVPELASRDHIRRLPGLIGHVLKSADATVADLGAIAYTQGPGLAGALLVGAGTATALAYGLGIPAIAVHHLEGHLLSPLLSRSPPTFPFVALLVSGGHTQLMRVEGVGRYTLIGESVDDAAGEAFDKTAKLLGLGYPGGPALSKLAAAGRPNRFKLPRPMLESGNLDFSFSGLKTAVLSLIRAGIEEPQVRADIAHAVEDAITDVLVTKSRRAMASTGLARLVVAGGVSANRTLRSRLDASASSDGFEVFYPELELCTDNGAMIAFAGARRAASGDAENLGFAIRPRWNLADLAVPLRQAGAPR